MLIRGEQLTEGTDLVRAMIQNIAIMTNDTSTLQRIEQEGGLSFREATSSLQKELENRNLSPMQKYDAWASSMVDLLYRASNKLDKTTLDKFNAKDLENIALFKDMVLQTHDHKLMNYGIVSENDKNNFLKKVNSLDSYLPDNKNEVEKKQNNMLQASGVKVEVKELNNEQIRQQQQTREANVKQSRIKKLSSDFKKRNPEQQKKDEYSTKGEYRKRGVNPQSTEEQKRRREMGSFKNLDINKHNERYNIKISNVTRNRAKDAKQRIEQMYPVKPRPR